MLFLRFAGVMLDIIAIIGVIHVSLGVIPAMRAIIGVVLASVVFVLLFLLFLV